MRPSGSKAPISEAPRWTVKMNTGAVTMSPWSVYPQIAFSRSTTWRNSSIVVRSRICMSLAQQGKKLGQSANHRQAVRQRVWDFTRTAQQYRPPARVQRALDIVLEAVANHHRFCGCHFRALQRRVEDAAVRLHVT